MAGKRRSGDGHGNGKDLALEALHEVVAELRGFRADSNARLGSLEARMESTNERLESVEQVLRGHGRQLGEVVDRLGRVEGRLERVEGHLERVEVRLENIRDLAGERYRSLEERVAKLEARPGGSQ